MISPEKIEEWIKEVEQRPTSAPLILRYIANRLRDVTALNETLKTDNIALVTGKRVEAYERRITHLEYQLELLKRHLGGDAAALAALEAALPSTAAAPPVEMAAVLVYDAQGRVLRLPLDPSSLVSGQVVARLQGALAPEGERPRLLALPSTEELLFIFTSGRVASMPATSIPAGAAQDSSGLPEIDWTSVALPDEPRGGELLACLAPISKIALAEALVQVSRKGFVKKIGLSLVESILSNRYIGTGVNQRADKSFALALGGKTDRLALVSREGYLACLEVKSLPFSIEEAMRLNVTDHLVAAFCPTPGRAVLIMTQVGKVIQKAEDSLETASGLKTRGQAVFSPARRSQGVRVVGAAAVGEADWGAALHWDGRVTLHSVQELSGAGAIPVHGGELLGFTTFSLPATAAPGGREQPG